MIYEDEYEPLCLPLSHLQKHKTLWPQPSIALVGLRSGMASVAENEVVYWWLRTKDEL
jgi:hypothetical protein